MKLFGSLALACALFTCLATVQAACPGQCNGHGSCGANDKCVCHNNWHHEADCSKAVCPFGKSRGTLDTSSPHGYSECSSAGQCDRSTGVCECYEGFEGSACQRTSCPNKCSGNGVCQTIHTGISTGSALSYAGWDVKSTQACSCDAGWSGNDCSERVCPKGDDPLTTGQTSEVQTITLSGTAMGAAGTFALEFTNGNGKVYTTRGITYHDGSASFTVTALEIKEALESLPDQAIPSVTVAVTTPADATDFVFTITFSDPANSGTNNRVNFLYGDHSSQGHQPVYKMGGSGHSVTYGVTASTKESATCSNRGSCDSEKGTCVCYKGYTGVACEKQTNHA